MTMIEKVARALCQRTGTNPDDMNGGNWDGGSYFKGIAAWNCWIDDAKAAIEAMKEPTEGMKKVGTKAVINWIDANNTYKVMIEAALKE